MSRPGPIGRVAWALACLVALVVAVSTPRLGRADDGAPRTTSRPAPASKGPVAARTSPVLFPLERRTVTFEHRQHGPELDLGCCCPRAPPAIGATARTTGSPAR
jgi:hypothetical protein